MYYGAKALSSVYVWDIDNGFAAAILFKKVLVGDNCGCWDAINIMEVTSPSQIDMKLCSQFHNIYYIHIQCIMYTYYYLVTYLLELQY